MNMFLKGNGKACPSCNGRGVVATNRPTLKLAPGPIGVFVNGTKRCDECKGLGRVSLPIEEVMGLR